MARKGILGADMTNLARPKTPRPAPRGAVGALQSSLSKLQENAVQEIDPGLIDDAGLEDRLGQDGAANAQLRQSLKTYGQQVPVLLRPHPSSPGRFEIVYGRRRLQALKELGEPVKAMIRTLDDHALVLAQGQENTARQDLSFIEKASFAAQLHEAKYDRQTIADALSIDLPMVSRMLKVGTAFNLSVLRSIGSAPGIGRDRWMQLVKLMSEDRVKSYVSTILNRPDVNGMTSDERFEWVLRLAQERFTDMSNQPASPPPAPPKSQTVRAQNGEVLADIRSTARAVTVSIPNQSASEFGKWIEAHAEDVITDLHDRWQNSRSEDDS